MPHSDRGTPFESCAPSTTWQRSCRKTDAAVSRADRRSGSSPSWEYPSWSWHQPKTNARTRGGWFATAEPVRRLACRSYRGGVDSADQSTAPGLVPSCGLAARGKELVDGEGVERVLMHLQGRRLRLRCAAEGDSRTIWSWANDPETRAHSFSTEPIPWEKHTTWYAAPDGRRVQAPPHRDGRG